MHRYQCRGTSDASRFYDRSSIIGILGKDDAANAANRHGGRLKLPLGRYLRIVAGAASAMRPRFGGVVMNSPNRRNDNTSCVNAALRYFNAWPMG